MNQQDAGLQAGTRRRAVEPRRGEVCDLSIVIATADDAERIDSTLGRIAAFLKRSKLDVETLVVDDSSEDGIEETVAAWNNRFARLRLVRSDQRRGIGAAARSGLLLAEGRQILLAEVGLAAPIEDAPQLLDSLNRGADVAIASRKLHGAHVRAPRPTGRRTLEAMFGMAARVMVRLGARDLFAGLLAFDSDAARQIAERARLKRETFAVEWIGLAERMGLHVVECPVRFSHNAGARDTLTWTDFVRIDDLWKVRSLVRDRRAPMPQPPAKLLGETNFVKLDRERLVTARTVDLMR